MIRLENVCKSFDSHTVLSELSLTVLQGEHVAIMGESGCGKTTLLRIIAGLEKVDSGVVTGYSTSDVAVVFQESRLFDSFSVLDNVACVMNLPMMEARERARVLLQSVGLSDALSLYPSELSGGMAQRVSIARAMAVDLPILLLDEPFSALDEGTRKKMTGLLLDFCQNKTLVLVTHSRKDAEALTDRTVFLSAVNESKKD